VVSTADPFAEERAQLQAQARSWQSRYDQAEAARVAATTPAPDPAPATTAPAPTGLDVSEIIRAELRRATEFHSAVGALKEQFPNATQALANADSFANVEQLRVAAENEQAAFNAQVSPAVAAAVEAALAPYVQRFGSLQVAPAGATPGQGDGLPSLQDINAMSLDELDALNKAHPDLIARLHREALTTRL
jgi:mRNA-degrading endonuclease toxin of MazEF toxin-antitoxin module